MTDLSLNLSSTPNLTSNSNLNSNPPLLRDDAQLLWNQNTSLVDNNHQNDETITTTITTTMIEYELPVIDLSVLRDEKANAASKLECMAKIAKASPEWGFYQVVNHGVSLKLLSKMREEQLKLFQAPFEKKASCGLIEQFYRWGNPTATCPNQFSWNEAFHIPLTKISEETSFGGEFTSLREVMVEYAAAMQELAKMLAGVLVMNMEQPEDTLEEMCSENTCFLRLNRYPACPVSQEIFGLVPHTDSDFLTILHQDEVGGLQLLKDSQWISVKPNINALIVQHWRSFPGI